jgi:hypothetical protein
MLGGKYFAETMGMFGKFVKNVGEKSQERFQPIPTEDQES